MDFIVYNYALIKKKTLWMLNSKQLLENAWRGKKNVIKTVKYN